MCKQLDKLLENLPASLQKFICIRNRITKIENLPVSLQEFDCMANRITKIENLPVSLQEFNCFGNQITHVDDLEIRRFNGGTFDLKMYNAIKRIQKRIRRRIARRNAAAYVIHNGCYNWIWKPITRDDKLGIDLRLGMKKDGLGDFMYPSEMKKIIL